MLYSLNSCRCDASAMWAWADNKESEGIDNSWGKSYGPLLYHRYQVRIFFTILFCFFFVWISRRILRNLRLLLTYFEWLSWLFICGKTWKFRGKDENVRLYVYCYYHIMCPYCIAIMNGETIWRKIITDSKHG